MDTDKQASENLVQQALAHESINAAYLLIDAAKRLDHSLDVASLKKQCLELWLAREHEKRQS